MGLLENDNNHWDSFITMKRWLENRNKGKLFQDYFRECGYKKIAIYGAGDIGRLLYEEVKESDIEILYFVDRNAEGIRAIDDIPVITLQDVSNMENVDVLVITPIGNYNEICRALINFIPEMATISIREAVYEF